jgi:threonine/homoserine/homoserine lactone efflux protein
LGPIGPLRERRTLASGFAIGFVSGLGAATADASYAAIAGFSISAVTAVLVDERFWLHLVGGAFLVYLEHRIGGVDSGLRYPIVGRGDWSRVS